MRDTTVATPAATAETTSTVPPTDAIAEPVGRLRRPVILATGLSVAAAVVATVLAGVRRRGRQAEGQDVRSTARRGAPTSTINVNWGFALFGANVMGEQRRRGGRLPGVLRRRRP